MQESLKRALQIVGGPTALARYLGISKQAISKWSKVPPERVLAVEDATGGAVKAHELRPDIYRAPGAVVEPLRRQA